MTEMKESFLTNFNIENHSSPSEPESPISIHSFNSVLTAVDVDFETEASEEHFIKTSLGKLNENQITRDVLDLEVLCKCATNIEGRIDLVGEFNNVLYNLIANCILPESAGGCNMKCLLVDTNNKFSFKSLMAIINKKTDNSISSDILNNILCMKLIIFNQWIIAIHSCIDIIESNNSIGLFIFHSLSPFYKELHYISSQIDAIGKIIPTLCCLEELTHKLSKPVCSLIFEIFKNITENKCSYIMICKKCSNRKIFTLYEKVVISVDNM